jgi:transposase
MERPMPKPNDLSRSLAAFDQDSTLIAVIEMSQSSWLVAGIVPGIERQPLKKLEPDEEALLRLLRRWAEEAVKAGRTISRIAVAFEAGRDGFWLARWLRAHGIEAHVIHPTSVAVSREHRRAKTDRLDTGLLKRAFLGWLRGEPGHCSMAAIPTLAEEDAKRPNRERASLVAERGRIANRMKATLARLGIRGFKPTLKKAPERLETLCTPEGESVPPNTLAELRRAMARLRVVTSQIGEIERARLERLEQAPEKGPHAMVRLLALVTGIGIETADMLVQEVLSRNLRDRRAVARYAGLTGAPDESGSRRREKGLARAGNARVRRGMIQLAWRFLMFQKDSALAEWYRQRTENARGTRKTMIVALARKLLIALWRLVTTGVVPEGVRLRPAA